LTSYPRFETDWSSFSIRIPSGGESSITGFTSDLTFFFRLLKEKRRQKDFFASFDEYTG